jgi:hypothetical protein
VFPKNYLYLCKSFEDYKKYKKLVDYQNKSNNFCLVSAFIFIKYLEKRVLGEWHQKAVFLFCFPFKQEQSEWYFFEHINLHILLQEERNEKSFLVVL